MPTKECFFIGNMSSATDSMAWDRASAQEVGSEAKSLGKRKIFDEHSDTAVSIRSVVSKADETKHYKVTARPQPYFRHSSNGERSRVNVIPILLSSYENFPSPPLPCLKQLRPSSYFRVPGFACLRNDRLYRCSGTAVSIINYTPFPQLHRVRPDGTCKCRRRVTCAMDDAWRKSSRHRMSQETVTGRFPSLLLGRRRLAAAGWSKGA
ncbi:hypothetical protein EVAR_41279_1 [Eumeta japonica]|uniref:Uncharacterized protein n=1 Tax=Eumeta variegata TaxID=151549 RepID=A0A4C1XCF1_EUMVA|nr:hypothetical protein EVAR_41279_1 [Eumeta japonica]